MGFGAEHVAQPRGTLHHVARCETRRSSRMIDPRNRAISDEPRCQPDAIADPPPAEMAPSNGFLRTPANRANTCDMRVVIASFVLATALLRSAYADGDALVDLLGPREVAVGEAMRGGATGSTAIGETPAGLPLNHELVFEGGYGYRQSDDASVISLSGGDSTSTIPGCFYYTHVGNNSELDGLSGHDTANIVGTSVGYPITPHVLVGSSVKYYDTSSDLMSEPSTSGFAWDIGTTFKLTDLVNIGAVGYNILNSESPEFPRAI